MNKCSSHMTVHSVKQKSISLIFRMSCSGSHVTYSCHHSSSHFTFPMFAHMWCFSVFHSWLKKEGRELPKAENWPGCYNTVINPELSGGRIPLQDKYCHKSEHHWEYVEWGEKDNAETWPVLPPRNSDELWALVSDAWDEVASSQPYIQSWLSPDTTKSVVEAEGFWTAY